MKKVFFYSAVSLLMLACNQEAKKSDDTSAKNDDMKALYEKNLATIKSCITAFENKNLTDYASNVADSMIWNSPMYGDTVTTKAHYMESLKYWTDNWDNLHLSNAIFLPGLDTATHQLDGSVRYYGRWDGVNKATGMATQVNFYGSYDFNKDNKVIDGSDYFDVGGLMNAVAPKGKK